MDKLFKGVEAREFVVAEHMVEKMNLPALANALKLKGSKSEVRRYLSKGAVSVNGQKIDETSAFENNYSDISHWMGAKYLIIRFGKKEFYLLKRC